MPDPAFPTSRYNADSAGSLGMELRDYFAARAMAALIGWDVRDVMSSAEIAGVAYEYAEAMLVARMRSKA